MEILLKIIIGALGMTILGVVGGFIAQGIDRKLVALMQARIGPLIRQPYWDFLKLMQKENVVPEHAIPWLYNGAPVLGFASVISVLLYLPFGDFGPILEGYGDLVLIMYLLAIPSLAMVVGGLASSSPYATIGAQREMVTMIAYELPLGVIVIAFGWKMAEAGLPAAFSLLTISSNPVWNMVGPFGAVGFGLLLLALIVVTPAELSKVPFDAPEAKSELADGLFVEYSGRNLAFFSLSTGAKIIAMNGLTIALFFPYNLSPYLNLSPLLGSTVDILFFIVKLFIVMFISVSLMRAAMARFRINQTVDIYWKLGGTLTGLGLIIIILDARLI